MNDEVAERDGLRMSSAPVDNFCEIGANPGPPITPTNGRQSGCSDRDVFDFEHAIEMGDLQHFQHVG